MRRLIRIILSLVILIPIVAYALYNSHTISLFIPFSDYEVMLSLPLYTLIVVLCSVLAATWSAMWQKRSQIKQLKRTLRESNTHNQALQQELEALKAEESKNPLLLGTH